MFEWKCPQRIIYFENLVLRYFRRCRDMFLFELSHSGCELWGFKSPHNSQLALGLLVVGQDLSSQLLIQSLPIDCKAPAMMIMNSVSKTISQKKVIPSILHWSWCLFTAIEKELNNTCKGICRLLCIHQKITYIIKFKYLYGIKFINKSRLKYTCIIVE